jgi:hypothetical protein
LATPLEDEMKHLFRFTAQVKQIQNFANPRQIQMRKKPEVALQ